MTKGTDEALRALKLYVENKERRTTLNFEQYLADVQQNPQRLLRNIFQLVYDMVKTSVAEGKDEYPDDPERIGFVKYDCSKLFVEGSDNPFFADRLFANRLMRQVESLKHGSQQNRVHIYEGAHGCGKSTFLNSFLRKFEDYTQSREGQIHEICWAIDMEEGKCNVSCPSHDHPMLIIPKPYRIEFLQELLSTSPDEIQKKVFHEKEYEWLMRRDVCTICRSLFTALLDRLGSFEKVLGMVKARPYVFDRRLGEGISIFNPGDKPMKDLYVSDRQLQAKLDKIFGANLIKYVYSHHAKTNNGIYALMDIKSHNKERLLELHNIISEGVHKVNGTIEEEINSLFIALMNPEDKTSLESENLMESFRERIQYNKIAYVMEVQTEIQIYQNTFGDQIKQRFLPRVIENFARVIISSRMKPDSKIPKEWIPNMGKYKKYCDEAGLLLRMEIFGGIIPEWLSEEDKKNFTRAIRRNIIANAEDEGGIGFSGRDSIRLFGDFFKSRGSQPNLITMNDVAVYFKKGIGRKKRDDFIPKNFLASLIDWYDYTVLNEVKEALYFYNQEQISEDILNYMSAVNYDVGSKTKCKFTGKSIHVTAKFLKHMGSAITGEEMSDNDALRYAQHIQKKFVNIMAQDQNAEITETELYLELYGSYARHLKEKVFQPFLNNENFREAVKSFGSEDFEIFDTRLKEHIVYMISNLAEKFGYTEQGAKEICLYVVDQALVKKFA